MKSFLSCKPAVTVINEDYEIILCSLENGILAVEIDGERYYEENSGVLSSEKNYAKIRLSQSLLDKAEKYTVVFKKSLERVAYWSKMGEEEREEFKFKPLKKRGEIRAYHLADRYTDRLTANGPDTYYTFKVGALRGIVLDLGEDKSDSCIEYGGVNNFYSFRRRETQFLKSIKCGKSKPLFAICHSSPAYNTERLGDSKFDIEDELFTEWNKELDRLGIKFMIIGNFHKAFFLKKNDERSRRAHSYPVIVGSECRAQSGDFSGTPLTFSENTLKAEITNTKKKVKATAFIDLESGDINL